MSERIEKLEGRVRLTVTLVLISLVISAFGTIALSIMSLTEGDFITPVFMIGALLLYWHAARNTAQSSKGWAAFLAATSILDILAAPNAIVLLLKLALAFLIIRGCIAVFQLHAIRKDEPTESDPDQPKAKSALKTAAIVGVAGLAIASGALATQYFGAPELYTTWTLPAQFRQEIISEGLIDRSEVIQNLYSYNDAVRYEYVFYTDSRIVFHGEQFDNDAESVDLAEIEYYELAEILDGEFTGLYVLTTDGTEYAMAIPRQNGHDRMFFSELCEYIDQRVSEAIAAESLF